MVRVTVWGENVHERNEPEVRERYPEGLHGAIAAGLTESLGEAVQKLREHAFDMLRRRSDLQYSGITAPEQLRPLV